MSWIRRSKAVRDAVLRGEEPEWLKNHPRRDYVRQRILATPPWMTAKELEAAYALRGPGETLDHIVPLKHPMVCGLHVPWNLEVMSRERNAAKSNKWNPHQLNFVFFSGQIDFLQDPERRYALIN